MSGGETIALALHTSNLDELPVGVVRLSTDLRATFVNKALRDMMEGQVEVGTHLADVAMEQKDRELLRSAVERRFGKELGETYRLAVKRRAPGTSLYLEVTAVPEYNAEGKPLGSFGIVRNITTETIAAALHADIQHTSDAQDLMRKMSARLRQAIYFDSLRVSLVSKSGEHLRVFFEDAATPARDTSLKWWPIPPGIKPMLTNMVPGPAKVDEIMNQPEILELEKTDPRIGRYRALGYKHMLRLPVWKDGVFTAQVAIEKREDVPFSADEVSCFLDLPIVEIVHVGLTLERNAEVDFAFELIRKLGDVADRIGEVAKRLVTLLHERFGWEHVSLFRIDEDKRKLRIMFQAPAGGLPDGYSQGLSVGLLGRVATTGRACNEPDVKPGDSTGYIEGVKGTRSEMCLPVPGARLRWILNVESSQELAFAGEEQATVERLLQIAGFILDRTASVEMMDAIFTSVADAVIHTDAQNQVLSLNPAAEKLLGWKLSARGGEKVYLSDFIKAKNEEPVTSTKEDAMGAWTSPATENTPIDDLQWALVAPSSEYKLIRGDASAVPVLISAATLPADLGGKVYVATDLTNQERVARMETLKNVFQQIACETRLPIALAYAHLGDAMSHTGDARILLEKAMRQLHKADLPLQRIVRLAADDASAPLDRRPVPLRDMLQELISEIPEADARLVKFASGADAGVVVAAAPAELKFCIQSIVAFLVRRRAQSEFVEVQVSRPAQELSATVSARLRQEASAPARPADLQADDQQLREFTLAEPVIERLIRQMGGEYAHPDTASGEFTVTLPLHGALT